MTFHFFYNHNMYFPIVTSCIYLLLPEAQAIVITLETYQPVWASGGLAARDCNVSLVVDSVQLLFLSLFAFVRIR